MLSVLTVLLTLATQSAASFVSAQARAQAAVQVPQQGSGSAAGRSHRVSAASTQAKSSPGKSQHRLGKGELAALASARGIGAARGSDAAQVTRATEVVGTPLDARRTAQAAAESGRDATAAVGVPGPAVAGTEIVSQRTATTSVFQNANGTRTMRVYSRPVHFKQANGSWADINTSLVSQGADGRWSEKANTQAPSFAGLADAPQLVSIALDGSHSMAYGLQGAGPVAAKISGSQVTYPGALPFADVVYNAEAASVKESLVLHSADAPTRWVFPLQLRGLAASLDKQGDVVFTDASGQVRLTIPRGSMQDSAVNPHSGEGAFSPGVSYSLSTVDGGPALVMTLDATWLRAPGRVFPVTVDPTDYSQNTDTSTFVEDTNGVIDGGGNSSYVGANPAAQQLLKVGSYESGQEANSYLLFNTIGSSALKNAYIEGVGVALDETWAAQCTQHEVDVEEVTGSWNSDSLSSFPGVSIGAKIGQGTFDAGTNCAYGPEWEPIDLGDKTEAAGTQLVQSWVHGGANYGLALTADDGDPTAWKQFASVSTPNPPYLYVTYSPYGATYTPGSTYTAPTYSVNGSEQVKLVNAGATTWPAGTVLKADVYNSAGHPISIANEPSVAVPATAANGTATVTGVLPAQPASAGAETACWDLYVNGVSLNNTDKVTPTCVAYSVQDTAPSITMASPPSNTTVGVLSPQFYAEGVDPDNYPGKGLLYEFQVYTNPVSGSPALVADSGWLSTGSWQVPVGDLLWNTDYLWQVRVSDTLVPGLWSDPALFATTVQQPVMTGQLGASSGAKAGRTFDPLSGDYSTQATDAKVNVAGPALQVQRSYNSLDPRTSGLFGAGWSSEWDMQVQPDADTSGGVVVTQADGQAERFGRDDFALTNIADAGNQTGGVDDVLAIDKSVGGLYLYQGPTYSAATRQSLSLGGWASGPSSWNTLTDLAGGVIDTSGDTGLFAVDSSTGDLWEWNDLTGPCASTIHPMTSAGAPFSCQPVLADTRVDWNTMTDLTVTPPLSGTGPADLVALDTTTDTLYAYPLNADGTLGSTTITTESALRTEIGADCGSLTQLVGGTFGGKPGVVAIDTSTGDLVLFPITGGTLGTSTFGTREVLGTGWNQARELTGVNKITGDSGTDLIAVDNATGIQWLYHPGSAAAQSLPYATGTRTATGMSLYTPPAGDPEQLAHQADGTWTLRESNGTTYTFGEQATPTAPWKLTRISDKDGHTQTLSYTNGDLATVTDNTSGRSLSLTWNAAGTHVASVSTGAVSSTNTSPLTWNYTYNTSGTAPDELDQVCAPPTGGNTAPSCTQYTYTSGASSGSHYRTTVMDAAPSSYWRLGEAPGTDTAASQVTANEGNDDATYSNVTLGASGPLTNFGSPATSATFNGTSSSITLPPAALKDTYLTVGLWFKTSSPGILMQQQSQPLAPAAGPGLPIANPSQPQPGPPPAESAPVLYVGTDGMLRGEFYGAAIGTTPITDTAKAVDDGNWHYAVLTAAGNTQTLYLDGVAVGAPSSAPAGSPAGTPLTGVIENTGMDSTIVGAGYTGYMAMDWPSLPASVVGNNNFFTGQMAEVAVYQHPVGAPAIAEQYASATHAATEVTKITLPSGKQAAAVAYDPVNDRATQVTDNDGGVWKLNTPTVSGSTQHYRGTVVAARPSGYWRLADQGGTEATNEMYAARPVPNNGTYSNVALGAAGPFANASGTAATFDGSTSSLQLPSANVPQQGPGTISLWFKTTSAGVLFDYQSLPVGTTPTGNAQYDPALYVGTDGFLHGKLWTSGTPLTSTVQVNDGKWHFAVLDATSTSSQTMYLDGNVAVTAPLAGTMSPSSSAYVYVGAGTTNGWPAAPSDPDGHFTGAIADVAVFPQGLTATQVTDLESTATTATTGGCTGAGTCTTSPQTPLQDQTLYNAAVTDAHPMGFWSLGDASGNQAAEMVSSVAAQQNQGSYANTTNGVTGPWASGASTATSLNGTSSYVQLPGIAEPTGGPATVSIWFKANGPGVLYSYQSMPLGTAPNGTTDRWNTALYVGTDDKLHGEFMTGTASPAVSATTITYGQWYQATLVANGTTQQLYLDGQPSGTAINGAVEYNGQGDVYLGAGYDGSWPQAPTNTSGYLNGDLADFASYPFALDAGSIAAQYATATSTTPSATGMDDATAYRAQVVESGPSDYWRLNDPVGSAVAQDELGTDLPDPYAATYSNTTSNVAGGPAGSLDAATTFNGTSSSVQLPATAAPTSGAASIDLWFKTTTAGILYSYQSSPIESASSYWNPALYVGTDGKLHGLFADGNGTADQLTSTATVSDGKWHQAVLTAAPSSSTTTQTLYLDGTQQSTESKGTLQFNGSGYVYLGAGTSSPSLWPGAPAGDSTSTNYYNGSLAEVSYYPSALSATTVLTQYQAMGSSANPTPLATATVADPGGNTLSYQYNAVTEQLLAYTDAYGDTTRYGYDSNGYLYTVTDPDGHTTTTGHDAQGNTVSTTTCQNPSNCQTSYATYYLNPTNSVDPQNGELLTSSDARSASSSDTTYTTTYSYDANGHLLGTRTPSGRSESDTYTAGTETAVGGGTEPAGLLATSSDWDPTHTLATYSYYSNGDLAQSVSSSGLKTTYTYDNLGRVLTKTQVSDTYPNGLVTTYTWDGQGHPLTQTDPATTDADTGAVHTQQTSYTYDADGDTLTQVISDLTGGDTARTTAWQYNTTDDQVKQVTDPAGRITTYSYDTYGNVTGEVEGEGTAQAVDYAYTYSPMGQLQQTAISNYTGDPTNPVASTWQVVDSRAYDPAGRLASDTDAMGRTTSYFYNDDNTLAETELTGFHNADGTTRNVVEEQDTYDNAGNVTEQVTGGGKTTTTATYNADGQTTSTTLDPGGLNRTTSYTYDPDGDVTSDILTAAGTTQTRETDDTYDALGDTLCQTVHNTVGTTAQNSVTTWTYDERGLPLTMTSPDGNTSAACTTSPATSAAYTTHYTYDPSGQLTQTIAPAVTTDSYGTATNTDTTVSANAITTTGYDTFGDVASTDDPDGNTTTYTYNADGEPIARVGKPYTRPDTSATVSPTTTATYDALGRLSSETVDPNGLNRVTTATYDQLGDLVQLTEPPVSGKTPTLHASYDLDGEALQTTDPTGAVTDSTYDDLGRQSTSTQVVRQPTATADTTSYTYDDAGNQTATVDPNQHTSTATFDAAGEKLSSTDPLQNTTKYAYDLDGDLTRTTLPDGTATTTTYDQAGQAIGTANLAADGTTVLSSTGTTYDADGNQTSATDADQHTTTSTYNAQDELTGQYQPVTASAGITTAFGYDPDGNRTVYTHTRVNGSAPISDYSTYNTLGLLESSIEPPTAAYTDPADRTYTTSFDAAGEPVTLTLPGGVSDTSTYDADGHLTGQSGNGAQATTTSRAFGYDLDGRMTSATAGTATDTYTYNDRGSLLSAAGTGGTASYGYDPDGNTTTRTDTTGTATYAYDADDRLTTEGEPLTGTQINYGYNGTNQVTSISYGTGAATRSLSYDAQHRITSDVLKNPAGATEASVAYGYDNDGNVTSKTTTGLSDAGTNTYTYDDADRLASWTSGTAAPTTYAYDNDGNLTQAGTTSYTYDDRDRLVSSGTTSYTYDPRGTRTGVTTSAGTTTSIYDAFDELIASGTNSYTYDALGRLTTAGTTNTFTYDNLTDATTSDGSQKFDFDPTGNLVALTTSNGTAGLAFNDHHDDVVATYTPTANTLNGTASYNPWGQNTGTTAATSDLGYQEDWTDPTTNLVNTASRWYDPTSGSFTSRDTANLDPTSAVQGNRYAYADDQPLNGTDRTGHWCEDASQPNACPCADVGRDSPDCGGDGDMAGAGDIGEAEGEGGPSAGQGGNSGGQGSSAEGEGEGENGGENGQSAEGGGEGENGGDGDPTAQAGVDENPGDSRPTTNDTNDPKANLGYSTGQRDLMLS